MSYKANINGSISPAYSNAWASLKRPFELNWTWPKIEKEFKEKYHATLIRSSETHMFEFIKFKSKAAFVLFMLEWS
jgi:hypothetical protein